MFSLTLFSHLLGDLATTTHQDRNQLLFVESVGCFGNALELGFALEVKKDSCFFNLATFKDAFNDFVAVKWFACIAKDLGDDVRDSSLAVAPVVECVDAAADQDEALVFDKFIVDRLCRDVFSFEA